MKKAISIITVLAMLICVLSTAAYAYEIDKSDITEYPVVYVTGYSSTDLEVINDDGTSEQVWHFDNNDLLSIVLHNIAQIGIGLGKTAFGDSEYLAELVDGAVVDLCGKLACNPDGSSVYDVKPMYQSAAESNSQALYDIYGDNSYQHEPEIMARMLENYPRDKVYNYKVDWRMGAVECAKVLDDYIQQVKEISGYDKVNIFAVSHGGQVTATYLTLYGYKQDVDNAVLTVPAIRGAGLVSDMLVDGVSLDELNLINFIEHGETWENDYHWLVEAQELGFLDDVIADLVPLLFRDILGYWGSIWDFCPTEVYEQAKAKWLDADASAELIAKSDYMHYEVMPQFDTSLQKCIDDYGMNVSIVAGTDNDLTTGGQKNSDGIIMAKDSTGATCAPFGERFADGYVQVNDCGGKYKVSPAMTVDASTAYLPDNTWFVSGLFHGMTLWDDYTLELMMKLLLTDEITDVYSLEEYPQFHVSTNPSYAVTAAFNSSSDGYVSSDDTSLNITNLSKEGYPISILGITCDGLDLDFNLAPVTVIKPGETKSITFSGEIPEVSRTKASITVTYCAAGSLTPLGERTLSFTIMNGETDKADGFASANPVRPVDRYFGGITSFLRSTGLYNLVSMWMNIIVSAFRPIFNIF